jgi:hypothetical protein
MVERAIVGRIESVAERGKDVREMVAFVARTDAANHVASRLIT